MAIIQWIGTTTTSATTENFVAKDRFKLKRDGGICSFIEEGFKSYFLSGDGKIEAPMGDQELRYCELHEDLDADLLIHELGGEANIETTLTEIFGLMSKQLNRDGCEGCALVYMGVNIFYVKDTLGILRTVFVFWCNGGWNIDAVPTFGTRIIWSFGDQAFYRNSRVACA